MIEHIRYNMNKCCPVLSVLWKEGIPKPFSFNPLFVNIDHSTCGQTIKANDYFTTHQNHKYNAMHRENETHETNLRNLQIWLRIRWRHFALFPEMTSCGCRQIYLGLDACRNDLGNDLLTTYGHWPWCQACLGFVQQKNTLHGQHMPPW